jgi:drug/metabolite transporter (DMT)-like permease
MERRQQPNTSTSTGTHASAASGIPASSPESTTSNEEDAGNRIARATRVSAILVHLALMLGQVFFGMGSVIVALGLPACNPFAFALYREVAAGAILLALSSWQSSSCANINNSVASAADLPSVKIKRNDYTRFVLLGLAIFGNQAAYIAGIKLAGPVAAAVWQPSQPIMTAAIGMILGWEPPKKQRICGVLICFVACASMVLLSAKQNQNSEHPLPASTHIGYGLFFINCLCTSIYILLSKQPLRVYSPMAVTAWSYNIAAVFMALTAVLVSSSLHAMELICPDCKSTWSIPPGAWFALAYYILFASVGAYGLLTWANSQATGTLVISYTVLQPVTAAILTLVMLHWYPSCEDRHHHPTDPTNGTTTGACLTPPGLPAILGTAGICAGLALVIRSEPATKVNHIHASEYQPVDGFEK